MDQMADSYAHHAASVYRLAYSLTGDRAAAEDLLHEAFIRVFGRPRRIRPEEISAYLHRTTVNLAKSTWRRRQTARRLQTLVQASTEVHMGSPLDRDQAVWDALLALPVRQRAAVVLHHYEELTEREVADRLNCSPTAARSLIHRGIKRLRQDLEGDEDA